ncbi:MAG: hypothetical protein F6K00_07580 [Leptolyngbya sp. SIOISBB]|nr:hypothetical protein [Leptolyngbya sp. SIOISBB]
MVKTISLKADEKAVIYRRNFSSVPMQIRFDAIATNGGPPKGQVEIRGSNWIFPKPPSQQPLHATNSVSAGFWDTFFAIAVTADTDLTITLPSHQFSFSTPLLWGLVAIVSIIAIAVFWLS